MDRESSAVSIDANGGPRRVHLDLTINLGHILSAGVFLISAASAWFSIDKRITLSETRVDALERRDVELVRDQKEQVVNVETRLLQEINRERARLDQTQVRTADDIREIKVIVRDGFRDLDGKLNDKVDKPRR